ncbi:hypothetical protein M092_2002 [Parabacteroides distasonis str. 3776 D15 iv]|nr:hypothetical protein M092_2002 [Parabacteroides distasonis str. 3776 D15 iv]
MFVLSFTYRERLTKIGIFKDLPCLVEGKLYERLKLAVFRRLFGVAWVFGLDWTGMVSCRGK